MEAAESDKCAKRITTGLSSKIIRLAFYGMFRRPDNGPLDTLPGFFKKKCYLILNFKLIISYVFLIF